MAHCGKCGYGRSLDLLALEVGGKGSVPWVELFKSLRCETCRSPAVLLSISGMKWGLVEEVLTVKR